jgi:nickel-dependent lactate racemase
MFDENAQVGRLEGNPVREDLNEAGEIIGLDLAVNVVLDADKNIVRLLAGNPVDVLKEGAKTCAAVYGVAIRTSQRHLSVPSPERAQPCFPGGKKGGAYSAYGCHAERGRR